MNKTEFINALSEPTKKGCFNCKFKYENWCVTCHEHDPEIMATLSYQEDNWEWNGDK